MKRERLVAAHSLALCGVHEESLPQIGIPHLIGDNTMSFLPCSCHECPMIRKGYCCECIDQMMGLSHHPQRPAFQQKGNSVFAHNVSKRISYVRCHIRTLTSAQTIRINHHENPTLEKHTSKTQILPTCSPPEHLFH